MAEEKKRLWKVLDNEGKSCYGGDAKWSLPKKQEDGTWIPGEWMPEIEGELVPCEYGYHLVDAEGLLTWLGESIYEVEWRGRSVQKNAHVLVVSQPRLTKKCENWNKRTARLFACWCIRNTPLADGRKVWDLLTDERSRKAVEITERYVNGEATREELFAAQEAAWEAARAAQETAWAAAQEAAWAVAWEAAWAMATWATAAQAAWATAAQAAWEAARAAQETARAAARAAQVAKLIQILNGGSM